MSRPLIRFAKRLTAWDANRTDDEVKKLEFTDHDGHPDLCPSVFEIELHDLIRTYAEYATLFDPPKSSLGIDVANGLNRVDSSEGDTAFNFTRAAHREVVLQNEGELLAFIHDIRQDLDRRKHLVAKDEIIKYARVRLTDGDAEWLAFVAYPHTQRRPGWVAKLAGAPQG